MGGLEQGQNRMGLLPKVDRRAQVDISMVYGFELGFALELCRRVRSLEDLPKTKNQLDFSTQPYFGARRTQVSTVANAWTNWSILQSRVSMEVEVDVK